MKFNILSALAGLLLPFSSHAVIGGVSVGGEEIIAHRTVALIFVDRHKQISLCSGSILDSNHVLTARHCLEDFKKGYVIFSTGNIYRDFDAAKHQSNHQNVLEISNVERFDGYPNWNKMFEGEITTDRVIQQNFTDLSVLEFDGDLPPGYEPAHFLPKEKALSFLTGGSPIWEAGYGIATDPRGPDHNQGDGFLRKTTAIFENVSSQQANLILMGNGRSSVCQGDSGGPVMVEDHGDLFVVGVTSWTDCRYHSVHTLVSQEKLSHE